MFGLRVVRHNQYIPVDQTEEYDTLVRLMKREVVVLHRYIQEEINFFTKGFNEQKSKIKRGNENKKLLKNETNENIPKEFDHFEELDGTREIIVQFHKLGNESHEVIKNFCLLNEETNFKTIQGFYSRHRGMFLTLLHMMYDLIVKSKKLSSNRKSKSYFSILSAIREKINFMISLCNLLNSFESKYRSYLGENVRSVFPYNETFDMTKIELDNHNFYDSIGKQYYPVARSFFTFYVALIAGYYDTVKSVTTNELLKNLTMVGLGLVYQLFPKSKVNKCNAFANDECFKDEGMALWNTASSKYIAPLFEIGLVPISVSQLFQVPVTKYLKKLPEDETFMNYVNEGPELTIFQKQELHNAKKKKWGSFLGDEESEGESEEELKKEQKSIKKKEEEEEEEENEEIIEIIDIEEVKENSKGYSGNKEKKKTKITLVSMKQPKNCPELTRDHITGEISIELFRYFYRRIMSYPLKKNTISLRIIHDFPPQTFPLLDIMKCSSTYPIIFGIKSSFLSVASIFGSEIKKKFDGEIIFHCHGGGFIAMNSHTHEMYLRRWAKQFGLPIVSVDYTNAPEARYPTQVLECYLSYKFIVQNFHRLFGKKLKRIIVAGDSAGGNLCASLISLAVAEGFRVPDAAILNYPTFITAFEACPSRVSSYSDPLVSKAFLELVLGLYPPDGYPYKSFDPFLSPIVTPKNILEKFPPCYITACSLDPLFDDGIAMAKKLDKYINGKVHLAVHDAAPHGFLNFCDVLSESRNEIDFQDRWIKWLLNVYYAKKDTDRKNELEIEKKMGEKKSEEEEGLIGENFI